jgi:CheY-like chemotaxis protein
VGEISWDDLTKRVLVVDEDPAVTEAVPQLLDEGYDVRTAASGEEALGAMQQFTPDLLVVDKELPGMTGLDLVKAARCRLPHLPVIVITAAPERARDPIDVHLRKPFRTADILRDAVADAFERQRAARERVDLQRKLNEVVARLRRS